MARVNERTDVLAVLEVMEVSGKPLANKEICITGHLSRPRKQVQDLIRQAGGEVSNTVGWRTAYLVTNADWTKGTVDKVSSKYEKARRNGVKIISEQELIDLLVQGVAQ